MKRSTRDRRHGLSYTPEYRAWQQMRLRCIDPQHAAYARYGGRGITICDRWLDSPQAFLDDMGPRPSPKHEIDRIDNDKGYSPDNCRWATRSENDRNRRSNHFLTHDGETLTIAEWTERTGIRGDTLRWRLKRGLTVAEALTKPLENRGPKRRAA